jgi:hypothetical protein
MRCPYCNNDNDSDAQFCNSCGKPLAWSPPASPLPKKGPGWGIWLGAGVIIVLVILAYIFGWIPSLSGPKYDCSVKEGYVTIQNVPDADAYVRLLDPSDKVIKSLYIKAGSQGAIENICNGRYYLYYDEGSQWDSSTKQFAVSTDKGHFMDPLDFKGDNYFEISLVPGSGNARTAGDSNSTTEK